MTDEVSGFMAEVLAEEWGVDRDCVDCLIYRNYDHPSKNSICDGCFGSATHPNFRPISGHSSEFHHKMMLDKMAKIILSEE